MANVGDLLCRILQAGRRASVAILHLVICYSRLFKMLRSNLLLLFQRLPFDWKNPIGYLAAFSMEYLTTILILSVILCQTNFTVGTSLMLIALAKDIANDLHSINAFKANQLKLTNALRDSIELQSNAKKYFWKWNFCIVLIEIQKIWSFPLQTHSKILRSLRI